MQGDKELSVSFVQALILLAFNEPPQTKSGRGTAEFWTLEALCSYTGLGEKECMRVISSLVHGKVKLLLREKIPLDVPIALTDPVVVNEEFAHPMYRVKVASGGAKTPVATRDQESSANLTHKVVADRKFVIEAAIVRILKMRRRISHTDLVTEVFEQCKFSVEAADIKGRIETLIDREYIARDPQPGFYFYVA